MVKYLLLFGAVTLLFGIAIGFYFGYDLGFYHGPRS